MWILDAGFQRKTERLYTDLINGHNAPVKRLTAPSVLNRNQCKDWISLRKHRSES